MEWDSLLFYLLPWEWPDREKPYGMPSFVKTMEPHTLLLDAIMQDLEKTRKEKIFTAHMMLKILSSSITRSYKSKWSHFSKWHIFPPPTNTSRSMKFPKGSKRLIFQVLSSENDWGQAPLSPIGSVMSRSYQQSIVPLFLCFIQCCCQGSQRKLSSKEQARLRSLFNWPPQFWKRCNREGLTSYTPSARWSKRISLVGGNCSTGTVIW